MKGPLSPNAENVLAEGVTKSVELIRHGMPHAAEATLWFVTRQAESIELGAR